MAARATLVIVDESAARRVELKNLLAAEPVNVVGESGYGVEAVTLVEERKPALVLAAVEEPLGRAVHTIESIRAATTAPIVAYSTHSSAEVVRQAMRAGAADFLLQPLTTASLKGSIVDALSDGVAGGEGQGASPGAGTVITIIGAKGGIGKSTIATNLAAAIASRKEDSVLVIDMDTRFGDVAIMMDLEPRYVAADIAANVGTLTRDSFRNALAEHECGVFVLPSARSPADWQAMTPDQIRSLIRFAARIFDYVILDTPGVFEENVLASVEVSSQVILVTTVDITSVKDTNFVLEILERSGFPTDRIMVMVNHANGANTVTAGDVARVLHTPVDWEVPYDRAVSVGLQSGRPVVLARPRSAAAKTFHQIAARLTGQEIPGGRLSSSIKRLLPGQGRD